MHLGIDYGAKLAGTTAICYEKNKQLILLQSEKKKDADKFVQQAVEQWQPTSIFIDAMSPMFLGGLTARAIKLTKDFEKADISCYETYPAQIVKHYLADKTEGYKKQQTFLANFCHVLETELPFTFLEAPTNWHQVDSILAWWAGWRFYNGKVATYGKEEEGLIYI